MAIPIVTVDQVEKMMNEQNYRVIDVRRDDEYYGELGHIPGAQLVTLGEALDKVLARTKPSEKIIFACRSGARSGTATEMAMARGFTNVFNMEGGMLEWNRQALETER